MSEFFEEPVRIFAEVLNEDPIDSRNKVLNIINRLSSYIEGNTNEDELIVPSLVDQLLDFTIHIPMPIPLSSGAMFTRAVRCKSSDGSKGYASVSRLSYIPNNTEIVPELGRLNGVGSSVFYASLNADLNSVGVVLAECNAQKGDVFNVLFSTTKSIVDEGAVHVIPLGIFDYFRRGTPNPFFLNDLYRKVYDLIMSKLHQDAKVATQLCDAFLTDILKRTGSNRLYAVTSEIAKFCMSLDVVDGVIYPSTKFEGHPNLALKPASVDQKLQYQKVQSVRVLECFGYGMYKLQYLGIGTLKGKVINWIWHPNADDIIS